MDSTSTPTPSYPALGPIFISADDAAYWVHQQIGSRRDRAYGGVIVQRGDGKFRPTLPAAGRMGQFDFDSILAPESTPEGYSGVAYYVSHSADHAEVQRLHPDWTAEQVKLYLGFFSRGHLLSHLQDPGAYGQRHYLSGPDGSLIKYESTEPVEEKKLFAPGFKPFGPFSDVEQLIRQVAQVGTLSVLVANAQWGGKPGAVPINWTLGTAVTLWPLPEAQPFFAPVSDQAGNAIAVASQGVHPPTGSVYLGFVLRSGSECIATYPVESSSPDVALVNTFPMTANRKLEPLLDFILDGIYFLSRPDHTQSAREPWLYERFFAPQDLAAGIRFSKRDVHRQEYEDYLKVYALTQDDAVLQYQPSMHIREAPLEDSAALNAQLKAGTRLPGDYVRQVAAAGELSVLRGSALWDVIGRVGPDWLPYAGSRRVSPTFVTADDAARYAHGHIGSQRDQGYVGLILQDADKRFVATRPVVSASPRFTLDRLCPRKADGSPIILAEGYSLHGMYASRWPADARRVIRSEQKERQTAEQMFTDEDIRSVLEARKHVAAFYLCGSADSLLLYRPDERQLTAIEQLQARVAVQADGNTLVGRELAANTLEPSALVAELAGTGELRVVVGNDVWGPRGTVFDDNPSTNAPVLGAVFATVEQAVLAARDHGRLDYRAASSGLGFVLKHKQREDFVVTETVSAGRLDELNRASDFGAPVLIDEYRTHCVYYVAQWLAKGLSTADAWFARHFMPITDLVAAIYDDKATQRLRHHQDLNIYIATLDGALLRYRYSTTSNRFDQKGAQELLSLLANDTPPFTRIIQLIARAGALEVLRTSELWDEPGIVGAGCKPYALIQRRTLSPAFLWQDDAARYALAQLGQRRDRIYGGLVLRRADGLFVATLPVAVDVEDFPVGWIRLNELADKGLFLAGSTVVARYHSRVAVEPVFALSAQERGVYRNMFSTDFLSAILPSPGLSPSQSPGKEYLMGLDGSLISYTLSGNAAEKQLAQALASPSPLQRRQNPIELQMRSGALAPSEYVNQVARAGRLQVVQGSRLWGEPKRVAGWVAYPTVIATTLQRFAVADPALSPVFTQMDDAMRHVHRTAGARDSLSFGFVLKSLSAERYVTTLPVAGGQGSLTVERVFAQGLLPLGYGVEGLYLCLPTGPGQLSADLNRSFISPQDLVRGLDAIRVSTAQGDTYLKLYLSCADDALLRYEPLTLATEWASFPATSAYGKKLKTGQEPLLEYLRKVISNGELRVVVRSVFWSPFRVNAKGVKSGIGLVRWPRDNRVALGPIFAHADDAARSSQQQVGAYVGQQYLGGVLVHQASASFVPIEPLDDGPDNDAATRLFYSGPGGPIAPVTGPGSQPLPLPVFPQDYKVTGVHQFYKAVEVVVEQPGAFDRQLMDNLALADLKFSTEVLQKNGVPGSSCYLTCRGGALLKFTPNYTTGEATILEEGLNAGVSGFLTTLLGVSKLQVLEVDRFWTRLGPVSPMWLLSRQTPAKPGHDEL
ncbi:DUF4329 domain-containing protein [Pseudomonas frederiksbergensis]|uniref:DUF4329 domain-containing protein n=1 Tax=Pseudomonas frederiksbergensis TaxID=104087 RepID=UPI003D1B3642